MSTVALVPLNRLSLVKSRLKEVVSDRPALALRLLERVVGALSPVVDRVVVATPEACLADFCEQRGCELFVCPGVDLNDDLHRAAQHARAAELLVALGDLPRLESSEVRELLAQAGNEPRVTVLAPDRSGQGTNLLYCRPAGAVPFCFGPDSLERHRRAAASKGVAVRLFSSPGTREDLDTPEHLRALAWA